MSARRNRRHRGRRRSPLPFFLILVAIIALLFIVFRTKDQGSAVSTDPPASSDPAVSAPASDKPSPPSQSQSQESAPPEESTPLPQLPHISDAPWALTLANADHPLPENWDINTKKLSNGLKVDSRIYDALTAMLNDCKAEGLSPIVCSAYRTITRQTELFEAKIDKFMRDGLSYDEAYAAASEIVAIPGTSEHNLGLAVDICALDYQLLNDAQADTPEQQWLMEHCAEYGFILRYPKGKEDITGIIWEPWHYRYVGPELAPEIMESGLCLEEYLALHYEGVFE